MGNKGWAPERQDGRRFVVTGATSGLGLATAQLLAERGAEVVLAVRNTAKGEDVAKTLTGKVEVRRLDVANLSSVREFAADLGPVDVDASGKAVVERLAPGEAYRLEVTGDVAPGWFAGDRAPLAATSTGGAAVFAGTDVEAVLDEPATISGTVTGTTWPDLQLWDIETGELVRSFSARTGDDGKFTRGGLPVGTFVIGINGEPHMPTRVLRKTRHGMEQAGTVEAQRCDLAYFTREPALGAAHGRRLGHDHEMFGEVRAAWRGRKPPSHRGGRARAAAREGNRA